MPSPVEGYRFLTHTGPLRAQVHRDVSHTIPFQTCRLNARHVREGHNCPGGGKPRGHCECADGVLDAQIRWRRGRGWVTVPARHRRLDTWGPSARSLGYLVRHRSDRTGDGRRKLLTPRARGSWSAASDCGAPTLHGWGRRPCQIPPQQPGANLCKWRPAPSLWRWMWAGKAWAHGAWDHCSRSSSPRVFGCECPTMSSDSLDPRILSPPRPGTVSSRSGGGAGDVRPHWRPCDSYPNRSATHSMGKVRSYRVSAIRTGLGVGWQDEEGS